jgi:hypothetical protein
MNTRIRGLLTNQPFDLSTTLLVVFVAIFTHHRVMTLHRPNISALTTFALDVANGQAHWRAFQNRLLGPYILKYLTEVGLSQTSAWELLAFVSLFTYLFLATYLLSPSGSWSERLLVLFVSSFSYIVLQHFYLYPWDNIELVVFTLFSFGLATRRSDWFFVLLFAFALLNRESALVIAVYLCISACEFSLSPFRTYIAERSRWFKGFALFIFGVFYTKTVRDMMFKGRVDGTMDTQHQLIGNHIYLIENVKEFVFLNDNETRWFVPLIVAIVLAVSILNLKSKNYESKMTTVVVLIVLANITIFGIATETRMYLPLIPLLISSSFLHIKHAQPALQ